MEQPARSYNDEEIAGCLFREANDAFLIFDPRDDRVLDVNPAAQRLTGQEKKTLCAMHVTELFFCRNHAKMPQLVEAMHKTGFFHSREGFLLRRREGEPLPVNVSVSRIHTQPAPLGLIVARDISERLRAQEEQLRLAERLQQVQRLESLGVLAAGVAHVFNNQLTGILGNAWLALLSLPANSTARGDLEKIVAAAQRVSELCRQLQACSGQGPATVEELNLSELVRGMDSLLQAVLPPDAVLQLELAETLPPIQADAAQLRQAVVNLVVNAGEALSHHGAVSVVTRIIHADRALLERTFLPSGLAEGVYVDLVVKDTGSGMDEATRQRIFEPFFTTKFPGRGLGLSAVMGIVRSHRGTICVQSRPGAGTSVHLLFPLPAPA